MSIQQAKIQPPLRLLQRVLSTALLTGCIAGAAKAQHTTTGTTGADITVIQSYGIFKTADLRFGYLVPGTSGGTITVSTASARGATGSVSLPTGLTYGAAAFTVLGIQSEMFTLTLPNSMTLTRVGGSQTMTVTNFISNPSGSSLVLGSGGSVVVTVGATLAVSANQVAGQYNGTFDVTVFFP